MYVTPCDETGKIAVVLAAGGTARKVQAGTAEPGQWTTLRVVCDKGACAVYVNGKPQGQADVGSKPEDLRATACFLGRDLQGNFFKGALGTVSFYGLNLEHK